MEDIFYGTVISKERFLVKRTRSSRHEEVWNVEYDDLDAEQMNRFELARAIALAERLGHQDRAGGPGGEEENPGNPGEEEDAGVPDEDPMDIDGEDMLQRPDIQRFLVHERRKYYFGNNFRCFWKHISRGPYLIPDRIFIGNTWGTHSTYLIIHFICIFLERFRTVLFFRNKV